MAHNTDMIKHLLSSSDWTFPVPPAEITVGPWRAPSGVLWLAPASDESTGKDVWLIDLDDSTTIDCLESDVRTVRGNTFNITRQPVGPRGNTIQKGPWVIGPCDEYNGDETEYYYGWSRVEVLIKALVGPIAVKGVSIPGVRAWGYLQWGVSA